MALVTPEEVGRRAYERTRAAIEAHEWPRLTDEQRDQIAALVGPDLQRMRAERTHDHRAA